MTPAERLAKQNPTRKLRSIAAPRKSPWVCALKSKRILLRLSLRAVAKAVGLSVSALFIIEQGGDPCLSSAARLSKFFGLRIEEIWQEKD